MLVCGEDLGMVPSCVPDVMKETGILSLEIQRMPKDISREFFNPGTRPLFIRCHTFHTRYEYYPGMVGRRPAQNTEIF